MRARSLSEVEQSWSAVDGVRKVSDRVIGLGPFGIGLDGLIAMTTASGVAAPVGVAASTVYTWGAGLFLVYHAIRAHASAWTLIRVAIYLLLDTVMGAVPFLSAILDVFFQGHLYASRAIQKEIERTHWVGESLAGARAGGRVEQHLADMRANRKKRVVFLGGGVAGGVPAPAPVG
ncbi:DUF4112 domain-containing protein [Caulobacter sp. 17J80-11]|uniref:DUF4112 domain-containing protein n=1 Tax=Caulobacter sp. 17J80-11 TaxID=2763502 RepID=UPI0016536E2E|nr:DUF4112 domain-containing protein [Caulobacter sp. 17J80-11]MBC6983692.1 DUF4112 domain-containing protein [Caulobacter sp. 17J80-11]